MGFFQKSKKLSKVFFNFDVKRWLGFDGIKTNAQNIASNAKKLLIPEKAEHNESFNDAIARLKLTASDLQDRKKEFKRLFIFFLVLAAAVFSYSVYIAINNNFYGFLIGLSLTIYALSQAFKYHFWLFQIKSKKLGCSVKEWLNAHK